jgi:hypothetical protein
MERVMNVSLPKWISDPAILGIIFTIVGAIFTAGVLYNGVNNDIKNINNEIEKIHEVHNKEVKEISDRLIALETAMKIHHGADWSERILNNNLLRVAHLERSTSRISDMESRITAINIWTKQADELIKKNRLEEFTALAIYSNDGENHANDVWVNKQHIKGNGFNKGDYFLVKSPISKREIDVHVIGIADDAKRPDILLQVNKKFLQKLGLKEQNGIYELSVQQKPESLRWKSLDQIVNNALESN